MIFKYRLEVSSEEQAAVVLKVFHDQECLFYEEIQKIYARLLPFLPKYYGRAKIAYAPPHWIMPLSGSTREATGRQSRSISLGPVSPIQIIGKGSPVMENVRIETFSLPQSGAQNQIISHSDLGMEEGPEAGHSGTHPGRNGRHRSPIYHPWSKALLYRDQKKDQVSMLVPAVEFQPFGSEIPDPFVDCSRPGYKQGTFIVLEDLTANMKRPCIADIKMGKRHYGLYTAQDKRQKQTEKASKTTSSSLGIRICGLQVYKEALNQYAFLNKYEGRKLTEAQISDALLYFLGNGSVAHLHLLRMLIDKLSELRDLMEEFRHIRMYASSILLLYDAFDPREIQVKQIDFEHCYAEQNDDLYVKMDGKEFQSGPDAGYILGLENLIRICKEIYGRDDTE